METLLSLTSKRAGDWFKEELRLLGGLDHIVDKGTPNDIAPLRWTLCSSSDILWRYVMATWREPKKKTPSQGMRYLLIAIRLLPKLDTNLDSYQICASAPYQINPASMQARLPRNTVIPDICRAIGIRVWRENHKSDAICNLAVFF